jgi:hypothetical protein
MIFIAFLLPRLRISGLTPSSHLSDHKAFPWRICRDIVDKRASMVGLGCEMLAQEKCRQRDLRGP